MSAFKLETEQLLLNEEHRRNACNMIQALWDHRAAIPMARDQSSTLYGYRGGRNGHTLGVVLDCRYAKTQDRHHLVRSRVAEDLTTRQSAELNVMFETLNAAFQGDLEPRPVLRPHSAVETRTKLPQSQET